MQEMDGETSAQMPLFVFVSACVSVSVQPLACTCMFSSCLFACAQARGRLSAASPLTDRSLMNMEYDIFIMLAERSQTIMLKPLAGG